MNRQSKPPGALALWVSLAVVASIVAALSMRGPRSEPARRQGFRDAIAQSGIGFRMSFLPSEQGETFKVNLYDHGCGVSVADYDGDGDDDLYFLNQLGPNALYRNRGNGTFEDVTHQAGPLALGDRVCVGAAFGDYDNDGDQDLYVTSTRGGNVLFENQGRGRFRDVTERAGVGCVAHSQTPAFFDYDNDGDLDLFIANTARWTTDDFETKGRYYRGAGDLWTHVYDPDDRESNVLFRNDGEGVFTDATQEAGVAGKGWGGDLAVFDFDADGSLDVFITNMFGQSQLLRNDGRGRFEDVTRQTLRQTSLGAIGCKAFDYNNDGRLDLFIADMHSDMWIRPEERRLIEPHKKYPFILGRRVQDDPKYRDEEAKFIDRLGIDYRDVLFGNTLFHNDGQGQFTEVSDAAGMETFWPWGVAVGDFDNDGNQDVYLPSGMGYPYFYYPSSLMMNRGNGTFVDRADAEGIEPPARGPFLDERIGGLRAARSSRCAAVGDFDGDGRLDLIVNNFNDAPYYFRNQFPHRHYVAFRLRGTRSNRDAIGAVVELRLGDEVLVRQVQPNGGYLSQSSKTLHFGLGDRERLDRVEVRWPSGKRQTLAAPAVDRLHDVMEPED